MIVPPNWSKQDLKKFAETAFGKKVKKVNTINVYKSSRKKVAAKRVIFR